MARDAPDIMINVGLVGRVLKDRRLLAQLFCQYRVLRSAFSVHGPRPYQFPDKSTACLSSGQRFPKG